MYRSNRNTERSSRPRYPQADELRRTDSSAPNSLRNRERYTTSDGHNVHVEERSPRNDHHRAGHAPTSAPRSRAPAPFFATTTGIVDSIGEGDEIPYERLYFGFDFDVCEPGRGPHGNARAPEWMDEKDIQEILWAQYGRNIPRGGDLIIPEPHYNGGAFGVREYPDGYENPRMAVLRRATEQRLRPNSTQFDRPEQLQIEDAPREDHHTPYNVVLREPRQLQTEDPHEDFPPLLRLEDVLRDFPEIPPDTAPVPASASAVASLPRKQISDNENGQTCGICMEEKHTGDTVTVLPCSHWFCKACIETWLNQNGTCPTCRATVGDSSIQGRGHQQRLPTADNDANFSLIPPNHRGTRDGLRGGVDGIDLLFDDFFHILRLEHIPGRAGNGRAGENGRQPSRDHRRAHEWRTGLGDGHGEALHWFFR